MIPIVFLDANVLVPYNLMSILLTMAEDGLFTPRWSQAVLNETSRALVEKLGRDGGQAQERAVDVQITRLRRKIEEDPKVPRYLQTVRGEGYMLASTWLQCPPPGPYQRPGGDGSAEDPGIRWWLEWLRDQYGS